MPKCIKCSKFYHPDFCIETEIRNDLITNCLFCYLNKDKLTIENEDGSIDRIVTKKESERDYKIYLKKLMENKKIKNLIIGDVR